jgi:hypothetical protein
MSCQVKYLFAALAYTPNTRWDNTSNRGRNYISIYVCKPNKIKVGTKPPKEDKYTANNRWHKLIPTTTLVYTYKISHVKHAWLVR